MTGLKLAALGKSSRSIDWYWQASGQRPPARLSKVELRQLSRKQRKRRREGMYWDNVLAHTVRQNVREEKARLLKQERDDWRVLTENYDKPRARDSASPRMDCKRRLAFMFRCCRSCLSHPPRENKVPQ